MKRKAVSGIMLTFLLISMVTLASNVQPVKAEPKTWTVDDDGPADFHTIQEAINSPLVIDGDTIFVYNGTYYENVVVDKSVLLVGEDRSTTIVDGSGIGTVFNVIRDNVKITAFTIHKSGGQPDSGIRLDYANNCNVTNNNIANNFYGIYLSYSSNNSISGNNIITNDYLGIYIVGSLNNTLVNNRLSDNRRNFRVAGDELSQFVHDVDSSNTVDGKPVCYWVNHRNEKVPADAGYVALVNSTNISVQNLDLKNNGQGLLLAYSKNSIITGNNVTNNYYGIYLWYSINNSMFGNDIASNAYGIALSYSSNNSMFGNDIASNGYGIYLRYSSNNSMSRNDIAANSFHSGIYLRSSLNNSISGNNITNNLYGIELWHSSNHNSISGNNIIANNADGIVLEFSLNNSIHGNDIANNADGIVLGSLSNYNSIYGNNIIANDDDGMGLWSSNYNTIYGNDIANNKDGVYLHSSSNNKFHHNNFVNNTYQVRLSFSEINLWDDGYPSGGNFWSDYDDVDEYNGLNQDIPGSDGIWDHPYTIDENNQDRYPLISPWRQIISADLVKRSAWPEHHHFVLSKDGDPSIEDRHGTPGYQTLYSLVKNLDNTYILPAGRYKVVWTISTPTGIPISNSETLGTENLMPGETTVVTYDLPPPPPPGKYYVQTQCYYRTAEKWLPGEKIKTFSFTVVLGG